MGGKQTLLRVQTVASLQHLLIGQIQERGRPGR